MSPTQESREPTARTARAGTVAPSLLLEVAQAGAAQQPGALHCAVQWIWWGGGGCAAAFVVCYGSRQPLWLGGAGVSEWT